MINSNNNSNNINLTKVNIQITQILSILRDNNYQNNNSFLNNSSNNLNIYNNRKEISFNKNKYIYNNN